MIHNRRTWQIDHRPRIPCDNTSEFRCRMIRCRRAFVLVTFQLPHRIISLALPMLPLSFRHMIYDAATLFWCMLTSYTTSCDISAVPPLCLSSHYMQNILVKVHHSYEYQDNNTLQESRSKTRGDEKKGKPGCPFVMIVSPPPHSSRKGCVVNAVK